MRPTFTLLSLPLSLAAAGCTTGGAPAPVSAPPPALAVPPPVQQGVPPTVPAPPAAGGFRAPQLLHAPGLEGVIRQDAAGLLAQFGNPRLDMREGDMRKLQFAGEACVLDVYLYPVAPQGEPVATHVEARRASDGQDVDRAACVAALHRAR
jgi:hypothetical protein